MMMDPKIRTAFDNIVSDDRELQNKAYMELIDLTEKPVHWAYDVWDDVVDLLSHKNNRVRSIASQILSNLAKSDPQKRILKDFDLLLGVTRDPKFVTARHCLQAVWKVGAVGKEQQEILIAGLESRYHECLTEKNCTLIRYDIIEDFHKLYAEVKDEKIKLKALLLSELEEDLKYRKKYAALWKER